jgi:carboxyl-terminal processing protease
MIDKTIGFVKIEQFSLATTYEFQEATAKLKAQGMKKLIIDLRNNGGGVLTSATDIADEFLKAGIPIVETKGKHTTSYTYRATSKGELENIQVAILINSNSASASEILAGAIQDNDRGTIIGRRSFGKGLVQEDVMLRDGSNLRLTIARYYTPTGRCIQKPYSDDYDEYMHDQMGRYDNGEMYKVDSTLLVDSLKYKTPKGKVVYGGGGIMPDIFVPYDTTGSTWYYTQLRYTNVFTTFAFDFVQGKRTKWSSPTDFKRNFTVSDQVLNQLTAFAASEYKIKLDKKEFNTSKRLISEVLKAEIARQIWVEEGYYEVYNDFDPEVQRAIRFFK